VRRREDLNHIVVLTSGAEVLCSKRYWTAALDHLL
jgi:hypothetical protein